MPSFQMMEPVTERDGLESWREDGALHPYFSMDLVEGGDLSRLLRESGPLAQNAPDRSVGVVPSSQVLGSFRVPGAPGD